MSVNQDLYEKIRKLGQKHTPMEVAVLALARLSVTRQRQLAALVDETKGVVLPEDVRRYDEMRAQHGDQIERATASPAQEPVTLITSHEFRVIRVFDNHDFGVVRLPETPEPGSYLRIVEKDGVRRFRIDCVEYTDMTGGGEGVIPILRVE